MKRPIKFALSKFDTNIPFKKFKFLSTKLSQQNKENDIDKVINENINLEIGNYMSEIQMKFLKK